MLFCEASKMAEKLEKESKYTGKSARKNKDSHFSITKIKVIVDGIKNGEDQEKILKAVDSISKKTKRQIQNIKDQRTSKKFKSPMTRVQKRMLSILSK